MSHSMSVAVMSLGSASLVLLAASFTLHAVGCDHSANDLFTGNGTCVASPDDTSPKCICSTAADCPKATECMEWLCDNTNQCKAVPKTGTLPVAKQLPGDCKQAECTAGELKTVNDDSDLPANYNACMSVACVNGEPHQAPRGKGTDCNEGQNKLCNGLGGCVRCLEITNEGCNSGDVCLEPNGGGPKCVPGHCVDGTANDDESDIDCGGSCEPCDRGGYCFSPSDCVNPICAPDKVCCDSVCTGACKFCSHGEGTCAEATTGMTDEFCNGTNACAKGIGCAVLLWNHCSEDNECMSGNCNKMDANNKYCDRGSPGHPCINSNGCTNGFCKSDNTCQ